MYVAARSNTCFAHTDISSSQIAIAAVGRTEALLDYNRIRSDMSSMIY